MLKVPAGQLRHLATLQSDSPGPLTWRGPLAAHARPGQRQRGGVEKYDNRYSRDPANLAHHGLDDMLAGFTQILAGCKTLLRPGGLAVVTARPWRSRGELVDLPAAVLAAGASAGLIPAARCVALLAGLRGGKLIPRPSFFQLDNVRKARRRGEPWHLIVHEDVLIFRNPLAAEGTAELARPQPEPARRPQPATRWLPAQPGQRAA
ncbi:MAG: hypothetical protein ACR2MP_18155 [Streptosporangiaceae bacterium]